MDWLKFTYGVSEPAQWTLMYKTKVDKRPKLERNSREMSLYPFKETMHDKKKEIN